MQYTTIGSATNSPLKVSRICLGTMTWGEQNSEQQAMQQMDYALANGVNFFDTAEMYPVPSCSETQGRTETYIGNWFAKRGNRSRVILATKVAGPGLNTQLRADVDLDAKGIVYAVEQSLRRLQSDYIDLYQLHWPSRRSNFFGKLNYHPRKDLDGVPLEESLGALQQLVVSGKVRHIGLSNETPWGSMHAKRIAERNGWQSVVSIQNPYNLLNRSFEVGLSEVAMREDIPLLAYSPMAFGVLSGKYVQGRDKPQDRLNKFSQFPRYLTDKGKAATCEHIRLAECFGLSPATLSLAFVNHQPFVASNIIGATNMQQLAENIASIDVSLTPDQLAAIEVFSTQHSNPCP